ncbi:MAG: S8 family serine peptidase [Thermoleophilia bacterium]|nr:S8 family serine peptidase [Thermoleophilia bacterium]
MPLTATPPPLPPSPAVQRQSSLQPHLGLISWTAPGAVNEGPLVAVLDTGIDGTHPALREAVAIRTSRSFTSDGNPFDDTEGHGTHVAGIIGARDAGSGVVGVSASRMLIVKVADTTGRASTSTLVRGIRYATARGARIINISFGGGGYSPLEQEAIDAAAAKGVLVIAAAGNSGRARREFPGAYRHVLAVAAVDATGRPITTSTSGQQVALSAPGADVLSTAPGGYGRLSGTSMAAAVVSGVAARVWAARPSLTATQVARILEDSATDLGDPGRDPGTGAGMVDLARALTAPTPVRDSAEPNDDPRQAARTRPVLAGTGPGAGLARGHVGPWRDPRDDYRVTIGAGERVTVTLTGPPGTDLDLRMWRPGTPGYRPNARFARTWLAAASIGPGATERLRFTATTGGVHTVEVLAARGSGTYTLRVVRERVSPASTTGFPLSRTASSSRG